MEEEEEMCEYVVDVHTSKVSKELKVLYLWRVTVKTTRGFINIPLDDFHLDKLRHNNITNCTINVDRTRQYFKFAVKAHPI
jgi:hypothetical protein